MQDPATGSGLVTINLPDGSERHLRKCSPSDWLKLTNTFRAVRKAWKRAEMRGAPEGDVQAALGLLDRLPVRYTDVIDWLRDQAGQYHVILLSLAKEHGPEADNAELEADFDSLALPPERWLEVAAGLFNIPLDPPVKGGGEGKKQEGGSEDRGGAVAASPTGQEPPSSSATTSPVPATP